MLGKRRRGGPPKPLTIILQTATADSQLLPSTHPKPSSPLSCANSLDLWPQETNKTVVIAQENLNDRKTELFTIKCIAMDDVFIVFGSFCSIILQQFAMRRMQRGQRLLEFDLNSFTVISFIGSQLLLKSDVLRTHKQALNGLIRLFSVRIRIHFQWLLKGP